MSLLTYVHYNVNLTLQVRWSPFISSLFLSCSSDWTVRLWSEDQVGTLLCLITQLNHFCIMKGKVCCPITKGVPFRQALGNKFTK